MAQPTTNTKDFGWSDNYFYAIAAKSFYQTMSKKSSLTSLEDEKSLIPAKPTTSPFMRL